MCAVLPLGFLLAFFLLSSCKKMEERENTERTAMILPGCAGVETVWGGRLG